MRGRKRKAILKPKTGPRCSVTRMMREWGRKGRKARVAEGQRRHEEQRKGQERGHDGRKEQTAKRANCPAHQDRPKKVRTKQEHKDTINKRSRRRKLEKHAIISLNSSHRPLANDRSTWARLYTTELGTAMCIIVSLFRM